MALSVAEQEVIAKRTEDLRAAMLDKFFKAFGDAGVKFDAEGIQRQIVADLTQERRKLALQMLGFDTRWSSIEIDHDRKSVAHEFLQEHVGEAVKKWVDECLRPAIEERGRQKLNNAEVTNSVVRDFDRQFHYAAEKHMRHLAEKEGKAFAEALVAQFKEGMKLSQE